VRIALVSTCAADVPPPAYGGTERFVAELARSLTAAGHDVLVYATGSSRPAGRLRYRFARPIWPPDYAAEADHAAFARRDIDPSAVDVVHLNTPDAVAVWARGGPPAVVTLHHDRQMRLVVPYRSRPEIARVAVSFNQQTSFSELRFEGVIHHGLDPANHGLGEGRGGYLAFLGRIGPEKAPHVAIDAARRAGLPLRLAGPNWTGTERYDRYFAREVRPRLAAAPGSVAWLGELDQPAKVRFLQEAAALLVPVDWEEPFGLVTIEAMLTGTPVVAFARGAAPEIVEEGVTGFIVRSTAEMAARARDACRLDRRRCREHAVQRWSSGRMASDYEALYRSLLRGGSRGRTARPLGSPA
jgi:glycosyltransferase involved in cell wall biosynthesis